MRTLRDILQQPGLTNAQKHAMRASFLRRLHAALPTAYYEVAPASSEDCRNTGDWWHPEPRFHVACSVLPLGDCSVVAGKCEAFWLRYLDIICVPPKGGFISLYLQL